jgi:hypothetical protein
MQKLALYAVMAALVLPGVAQAADGPTKPANTALLGGSSSTVRTSVKDSFGSTTKKLTSLDKSITGGHGKLTDKSLVDLKSKSLNKDLTLLIKKGGKKLGMKPKDLAKVDEKKITQVAKMVGVTMTGDGVASKLKLTNKLETAIKFESDVRNKMKQVQDIKKKYKKIKKLMASFSKYRRKLGI